VSDETLEQAIFDHLALAERNKKLGRSMPIDQYRGLYGGSDRPNEQDNRPAHPDETGFAPEFEWDATAERSLPTFDDWEEGV
jgi:hypothetical protein